LLLDPTQKPNAAHLFCTLVHTTSELVWQC